MIDLILEALIAGRWNAIVYMILLAAVVATIFHGVRTNEDA